MNVSTAVNPADPLVPAWLTTVSATPAPPSKVTLAALPVSMTAVSLPPAPWIVAARA